MIVGITCRLESYSYLYIQEVINLKKEDVFGVLDKTISSNSYISSASMVVDGGEFEVGVRVTPKRMLRRRGE